MINKDRIVSVTATDLITLYGTIMMLANTSVTAVDATNPGEFAITSGSGNVLAAEPIKTFDIGNSVSSITIYFVPAYDYAGFTIAGEAATIADNDVTVEADGKTLYKAVLSSGTVTITKAGF